MQDWTSGSKDDLEANIEIIIATKLQIPTIVIMTDIHVH